MKVILTTTIKKLGKMGDTVIVKPGYARNFLFPNKMALRENKKNIAYYESIKEEIKRQISYTSKWGAKIFVCIPKISWLNCD